MAAQRSGTIVLAPGDVVADRFTVIDRLGRGNFSAVYLAKRNTATAGQNRLIVLKIPQPAPALPFGVSDFEQKLARNEIAALRRERRDGSFDSTDEARAKLLIPDEAFEHESLERPILLFTEPCGPSIHEFAKAFDGNRMPWSMAQRAIDDTLTAVQFLHERGVVHGDIQTRNLLLVPSPSMHSWDERTVRAFLEARKPILDKRPSSLSSSDTQSMASFFKREKVGFDGFVKLTDFGSGFVRGDGHHRGNAVRGDVKSPDRMEEKDWGLPADMWSVGCTVLEILAGGLLFEGLRELGLNWSNERGLEMLRDALQPDSDSDDAVRPALREFLLYERERSDVSSEEVGVVEEIAAQTIRWRPEARSEIADVRRIWQATRNIDPTCL